MFRFITLLLFFLSSCSELEVYNIEDYKLHYQLQNYGDDFQKRSSQTTKALWVIDPHKKQDQKFTIYDLLQIKRKKNLVMAYLSLGEAESYRPYFKDLPSGLLLEENPHWKGNYTVKYWDKVWHEIIYANPNALIPSIVEQGFDGVFLDVVDAFMRFENKPEYAVKMLSLVVGLAKQAKKQRYNFKIYLQNGTEIINHLTEDQINELFDVISGASIEGYFFKYNKNNTTEKSDYFKSTYVRIIERFKRAKKNIFLIEYALEAKDRQDFFKFCNQYEISCLITDRTLTGKEILHNKKQ